MSKETAKKIVESVKKDKGGETKELVKKSLKDKIKDKLKAKKKEIQEKLLNK